MKVFLTKARCAFPSLFEARSYEGADPKFQMTYLLPPDSPDVPKITAAIEQVAKEKWGEKAAATLKSLKAAGKVCLQDGDQKETEGFPGNLFVRASSKTRPSVVDRDGVTNLEPEDGRPYSGCYVRGYIDIWAMDNKFGKRIVASLGGVQFHSHGDPFTGGGGGKPDEFAPLEDDEEELV